MSADAPQRPARASRWISRPGRVAAGVHDARVAVAALARELERAVAAAGRTARRPLEQPRIALRAAAHDGARPPRAEFEATTISRFYAIHMLAVPGLIIALIGAHLYLVVKLGTTAPPWVKAETKPKSLREEKVG